MKKSINVVGAIVENDYQGILRALRSTAINLPNLWEFPGGKIDNGESQSDALKRTFFRQPRIQKAHMDFSNPRL